MCCQKKILRRDVVTDESRTLTFTDCGDGKIYLEMTKINLTPVQPKVFGGIRMKSVTTDYLEADGDWENRYELEYHTPVIEKKVESVSTDMNTQPTTSEANG